MATVFALSITACGSSEPASNEQSTAKVKSSVSETTAEPATVPTEIPAPEVTPEPTTEPTPIVPTIELNFDEPVVCFNGNEIKLGCIYSELLTATGLDIKNAQSSALNEYIMYDHYMDGSDIKVFVRDKGATYEDLGNGKLDNDEPVLMISQIAFEGSGYTGPFLTLPGDITLGSEITLEELKSLYGEPTKIMDYGTFFTCSWIVNADGSDNNNAGYFV